MATTLPRYAAQHIAGKTWCVWDRDLNCYAPGPSGAALRSTTQLYAKYWTDKLNAA